MQSQVTMRSYHDQRRREVEFKVGDWVWLRLQQRTTTAISAAHSKLNPKYYDPYRVVQKIGMVAYKLELPPRARIHDVFHVALLKKYEGSPPAHLVPLPDLLHGRVLPTLEKDLRARLNRGCLGALDQMDRAVCCRHNLGAT
jgi:hypothetical protein